VEDPAWMIGQPLQHLRVFVGGVVVKDGMDDLAGGNGALDGAEEGDELGVRVLQLEASGQLDRLLGWE
jgi:hypothetical protein